MIEIELKFFSNGKYLPTFFRSLFYILSFSFFYLIVLRAILYIHLSVLFR